MTGRITANLPSRDFDKTPGFASVFHGQRGFSAGAWLHDRDGALWRVLEDGREA